MPHAGGHLGSRLSQQPRAYIFQPNPSKSQPFSLGNTYRFLSFLCIMLHKMQQRCRQQTRGWKITTWLVFSKHLNRSSNHVVTRISSSVGPGNTSGFYTLILPSDQSLVLDFSAVIQKYLPVIFASFCSLTSFCVL